ncbi:uncharacterized protein LOC111043236 [Nilaparvata lugens]|uniref:uncharacterized protein LOC111043236 n=1 Tax=Nilaparvata lugens TaxID=108931 RepID=UPI00193D8266|nr:uncharacterized protein LOC111043236 [Nilaparvata lugens]
METWDFKLMRLIYSIFFNIFGTERFFEDYSRVVVVLDSLMRNIHSFIKMKQRSATLSVYLLTQLIAKTRQFSLKDIYQPGKLLQLLYKLYNSQECLSESKMEFYKLTYVLLSDVIEHTPKNFDMNLLKSLAIKAGILLYKDVESCQDEERKKKFANLMSKHMSKILRSVQVDDKHTVKITQHIIYSCKSLQNFPRMKSTCDTRMAFRIAEYFLTIAESFNEKLLQWLVKFISENGFLMFFLHHFQASSSNIKLKETFLKLLHICVNFLSGKNEHGDKLALVVHNGLSKIPATSNCALELEKSNFSSTQLAIITILYYHYSKCTFVQATTAMINDEMRPKETTLLKIFACITCSDSFILKMLLFLYAISSSDSKLTENERVKHSGYKRLLKLLSSSKQLEDLYSDNKIFIQWIVSSESMPNNFRASAITQWLCRRENDDNFFHFMIERNPKASALLLRILCACKEEKVLCSLLKILVDFQKRQTRGSDKSLERRIWMNLEKVLDYYLENPSKANNLAVYLKLASTENPSLMKADKMMQICRKLLKVIETQVKKVNILLTVALFNFIKILINFFIKEGEERGALIFFKTKVLINLFEDSLFHNDLDVRHASVELIKFISNIQRENNFKVVESMNVPLKSILKESVKSLHHMFNWARLYNSCYETETLKPIVVIEIIPEENRQRMCSSLYLNFLNMSFMIQPKTFGEYWLCMERLLEDADTEEGNQSLHLWTASAVAILISQSETSAEMLAFLVAWLTRLAPVVWRWTQLAFMYAPLIHHIQEVATLLANNTIQSTLVVAADSKHNITHYKLISKMIINLKIDLPPETEKQLEKLSN